MVGLYFRSVCPHSQQQFILNQTILQRYRGNTSSCLFQPLPQNQIYCCPLQQTLKYSGIFLVFLFFFLAFFSCCFFFRKTLITHLMWDANINCSFFLPNIAKQNDTPCFVVIHAHLEMRPFQNVVLICCLFISGKKNIIGSGTVQCHVVSSRV